MRQYELTYLISDDIQESEITKITGKIGGMIAEEKGKVLKEESWGRRKLAYPIKKLLFATYITINFELEPENLKNIERDLRHENSVVRYLLIVKKASKEKLSLTAEDITATRDIEQVVGGKKSFEAVEGETEGSKDLMAVRGEIKEEDTSDKKSLDSARDEQDTNKSQITKSEIEKDKTEKTEETKEEPKEIKKEVVKEKPEKIEKKPAAKKVAKKIEKQEIINPVVEKEEIKTEKVEKKPIKKKAIKKDSTASDEADRLAKLDEELNDILGEEL